MADPRGERILEMVREMGKVSTSDLAAEFGFTRQTAHRLLKQLVVRGTLMQIGVTRGTYYILADPILSDAAPLAKFEHEYPRLGLEEDAVVKEVEAALNTQTSLKLNIRRILAYALSEMVNNAVDHSQGEKVIIRSWLTKNQLCFQVLDNGIGVFRSVMQDRRLDNPFEAMQDLIKGKTTTYPERHSGEGIFFTSKVADQFSLSSYGYEMIVQNLRDDVFFRETEESFKGTKVNFCVRTGSDRTVMEVFNRYTSGDFEFDTTNLQVKLFEPDLDYVSRSQGRRMMASLDHFRHIVLDFKDVETIGQGFADEVFRVFAQAHPGTTITPVNMNAAVSFMVNRVGR